MQSLVPVDRKAWEQHVLQHTQEAAAVVMVFGRSKQLQCLKFPGVAAMDFIRCTQQLMECSSRLLAAGKHGWKSTAGGECMLYADVCLSAACDHSQWLCRPPCSCCCRCCCVLQIFCLHGGLSPTLDTLDHVRGLDRVQEVRDSTSQGNTAATEHNNSSQHHVQVAMCTAAESTQHRTAQVAQVIHEQWQ